MYTITIQHLSAEQLASLLVNLAANLYIEVKDESRIQI